MKAALASLAIAAVTAVTMYQAYVPTEATNVSAVTFVKDLDIERFMGMWYVIASKPNLIESNCKCSRTLDTLTDAKTIELAETCWVFGTIYFIIFKGHSVTSKSKAVIEEPRTGHWTNWMSFISGDYWVIDIEKNNYTWSVIGQPSKKGIMIDSFLGYWIMSREKHLDQTIVDALLAKAKAVGYDLSDIEYADQTCKD